MSEHKLSALELAATVLSEAKGPVETTSLALFDTGSQNEHSTAQIDDLVITDQTALRADLVARLPLEIRLQILEDLAVFSEPVRFHRKRNSRWWLKLDGVIEMTALDDVPFKIGMQVRRSCFIHFLRSNVICSTFIYDLDRLRAFSNNLRGPQIRIEDHLRRLILQMISRKESRTYINVLGKCPKIKELTWVVKAASVPVQGRLDAWVEEFELDKLRSTARGLKRFEMYYQPNPLDWRFTQLRDVFRRDMLAPEFQSTGRRTITP